MLTGEGLAHHGDILREATRLVQAGQLRPHVDPRHFNFETVDDAHRAVQEGTAVGKAIIDINP